MKKLKRFYKQLNIVYKVLSVLLVLVLMTVFVIQPYITRAVVMGDDTPMTYGEYAAKNVIPNKTEFIGTYLISMEGMNDVFYQKAIESQETYSQTNFYYKSELAGGVWYDASVVEGIEGLYGAAQQLKEEDLKDLYVTHVVTPEGKLIDAKTGGATGLFENPSPYDIASLPEMMSLYGYYKSFYSKYMEGNYTEKEWKNTLRKNTLDRYAYDYLRIFWMTNTHTDITDECDRRLTALQPVYDSLRSSSEDDMADILLTLMQKLDNTRRAEVYYLLVESDFKNYNAKTKERPLSDFSVLLNALRNDGGLYEQWGHSQLMGNTADLAAKIEKEEDAVKYSKYMLQDFSPNSGLIDLVNGALGDCQDSHIKYSSDTLEDPGTVMGTAEYDESKKVYDAAPGSDVKPYLLKLKHLFNIRDNIIDDKASELAIIDAELFPAAKGKYTHLLVQGVGSAYQAVINQGGTAAAAQLALEEQQAELDSAKAEFQFQIDAKVMRLSPEEAAKFLYDLMNELDALKNSISSDAFKADALASLSEIEGHVKDEARGIENGDASMASLLDELNAQRDKLLAEKEKALLDDNDLNAANRIDAMLADINGKIDDEKARLAAIADADATSAADRAKAENDLYGTEEGAEGKLFDSAYNKLMNGDDASNALMGLAALGAVDRLNDLRNSLLDANLSTRGVDNVMDDAKRAARANGKGGDSGSRDSGNGADGSGADENGEDGSEAGDDEGQDSSEEEDEDDDGKNGDKSSGDDADSKAAGVSEADILSAIEALLGGSFDSLDASGKIIAASAVEYLAEDGNVHAVKLAKSMINTCAAENNPYVYLSYRSGSEDMVSAEACGREAATGYRYVFNASRSEATLTGSECICQYVAGSDTALKGKAEVALKEKAVLNQNTVYVPAANVKEMLKLSNVVFMNTNYSAILKSNMEKKAQLLYNTFIQ